MRTTTVVGALSTVCAVGLYAQFIQYRIGATAAQREAWYAVSVAVRIAQRGPAQSGDSNVTVVTPSPVIPPPIDSRWLVVDKPGRWSYRPWRGARREASVFTLCSSVSSLWAEATRLNAHWVVQLTSAQPGECPRLGA